MSEYPEHEKLAKIQDESQVIGEFLDWCADAKGVVLTRNGPAITWNSGLLAEFFSIDQAKIDAEKEQMLADIRGTQP